MAAPNPKDLLDFNKPFNVQLFDQVVAAFYKGTGNKQVHDLLASFQQNPQAWKRAPEIIQQSKDPNGKIIALNVILKCIKTQWNILPQKQKLGMKAFVEELIIKSAQHPDYKNQTAVVTKLNSVLIEIVKREWPHNWPNFITQVVTVSKKSEAVCTNNVKLLRLLSEEATENVGDLTHSKQEELRKNLNQEFNKVFELCMFVLKTSRDPTLLYETFQTMLRFLQLKWIPIAVIFESSLIEGLALKYYDIPQYRRMALECMIEIASIPEKDIQTNVRDVKIPQQKILNMYIMTMKKTIGAGLDANTSFQTLIDRDEQMRVFLQSLTNFLVAMFRSHRGMLCQASDQSREGLQKGFELLAQLTEVNDQTIFQICLDYWEQLARYLQSIFPNQKRLSESISPGFGSPHTPRNSTGPNPVDHPEYRLYRSTLHNLKHTLMNRLPRPKEVLIVEDDHGNAVKHELKDTIHLAVHQQMSKILFILSQVDPEDTRVVISKKLEMFKQTHQNVDFGHLNSLCWSIGAIANAMDVRLEKSFLVVVIKILLQLCEKQRSKNDKAIIASCIMYVVRKYPRFLRKHWKFLQTVVKKLIEFLHEKHPGVQDMSIETLEEICDQTGMQFLSIQGEDENIFLEELLTLMNDDMCSDLEAEQIENLHHVWGVVIGKEARPEKAASFIKSLLCNCSCEWNNIVGKAQQHAQVLDDKVTVERLTHLLRIHKQTSRAVGGGYIGTMGGLYMSLLNLYSYYAQQVSQAISNDANSRTSPRVRAMSTVKAEILQLVEVFVEKSAASDKQSIIDNFVPKFLETMLIDYEKSTPMAREASCLAACCALIDRLGSGMAQHVNKIFKSTFQITLNMLQGNNESFPDHRISFFRLILAITKGCFDVFIQMTPDQLRLIVQCILWGVEHIDVTICEVALKTLATFLQNVRKNKASATSFYRQFGGMVLHKILHVMTDTLHKPNFPVLCEILRQICCDIQNGDICDALYSPQSSLSNTPTRNGGGGGGDNGNYQNNQQFIGENLAQMLGKQFPNLTQSVIKQFIMGCFAIAQQTNNNPIRITSSMESQQHPFLKHGQDFLVTIKELHVSS